jgi:DNA-binding CsgD family transcriptional regulator
MVKLTKREEQLVAQVVKGKSNQEIADCLDLSIHTVKMHLYNVFKKRNIKRRGQLIINELK